MKYNFTEIEKKWQKFWEDNKIFKAEIDHSKPKYYVLDMFPYPSSEGLHVGHPEGYTATDIIARYRRMKGYNVLHPMGWDSFGLPAEQYAVKTGIHPRITTQKSIDNFKRQLKMVGFSYDWDREITTMEPDYYKWTQWIFLQLFKKGLAYQAEVAVNWCPELGTVLANEEVPEQIEKGYTVERRPMKQWMLKITEYAERLLIDLDMLDWPESTKEMQRNWIGKSEGAKVIFSLTPSLSKGEGARHGYMTSDMANWNILKENARKNRKNPTDAEAVIWELLRDKRTGFKFRRQHAIDDFIVDFVCIDKKLVVEIDGGIHENQKEQDALRTSVLKDKGFRVIRFTNDEVLFKFEDVIEKIKEELENYDTKVLSSGEDLGEAFELEVFTTRPDTLWGATYMVIAPEHPFVDLITTTEHKTAVDIYRDNAKNKSDMERTALEKDKTGVFTGAYAINPVNNKEIPVWISDYVLLSYGTGAIMAVPAHDQRDWEFATKYHLPITEVVKPLNGSTKSDITKQAFAEEGIAVNSGFINGMKTEKAKLKTIEWLEANRMGKAAIQYKLRDWLFSRQRFWGEPFPIIHLEDGTIKSVSDDDLPVMLPEVETYNPAGTGESPLAKFHDWVNTVDKETGKPAKRETNTMPQWAGSCWYYLRFLDPNNDKEFCSREAEKYWMPVNMYIGGTEHTVLHLLYARFWHKVLFDLGYVSTREPFVKLYHQGMILGNSYFMDFDERQKLILSLPRDIDDVSYDKYYVKSKLIPVDYVDDNGNFNISMWDQFVKEFPQFQDYHFKFSKVFGKEIIGLAHGFDKMSKSLRNVVNPDAIVEKYGADSFRLFEMFMGPLSATKPWSTKGVEGVYRFLNRVYRFVLDEVGNISKTIKNVPSADEYERLMHRTIKNITDDIEDNDLKFNTCISELMIYFNEISKLETVPLILVENFVKLLSPFAPHIAEEFWQKLGHIKTIAYEPWPEYDPAKVTKNIVTVVGQVNGKVRARIDVEFDTDEEKLKELIKKEEKVKNHIDGREIIKEIVIKNKLVNIVVK
ncbi:MAG TPA: leucine--tRNA ligase [Ignavibacteria bacterium]|nr:leucine--tRNA ligase [Ignavibacteria bacterium]